MLYTFYSYKFKIIILTVPIHCIILVILQCNKSTEIWQLIFYIQDYNIKQSMIIHYNNVKNLEILVNLIKKSTPLKNTSIKPFPSIRNMIKCLDVIIMNY